MNAEPFYSESGFNVAGLGLILPTFGTPPNSGFYTAAPIGSLAIDTSLGDLYRKTGSGWVLSGGDVTTAQLNAVRSLINNGDYRESVYFADDVETDIDNIVTPAFETPNVTDGDRALFLSVLDPGFYVYTTVGVDRWVKSTEGDPTIGTSTYVEAHVGTGTDYVGARLVYNGANWVISDKTSIDSLAAIRAYIGMPTALGVLPEYTSHFAVEDNDDITTAIGKLDLLLKTISENPTLSIGEHSVSSPGSSVVSSISTVNLVSVKWHIVVIDKGEGTEENRECVDITALVNNRLSQEALIARQSISNKLTIGFAQNDIIYTVTLGYSGEPSAATQILKLTAYHTDERTLTVTGNYSLVTHTF